MRLTPKLQERSSCASFATPSSSVRPLPLQARAAQPLSMMLGHTPGCPPRAVDTGSIMCSYLRVCLLPSKRVEFIMTLMTAAPMITSLPLSLSLLPDCLKESPPMPILASTCAPLRRCIQPGRRRRPFASVLQATPWRENVHRHVALLDKALCQAYSGTGPRCQARKPYINPELWRLIPPAQGAAWKDPMARATAGPGTSAPRVPLFVPVDWEPSSQCPRAAPFCGHTVHAAAAAKGALVEQRCAKSC